MHEVNSSHRGTKESWGVGCKNKMVVADVRRRLPESREVLSLEVV